jgi:hypothetical protein
VVFGADKIKKQRLVGKLGQKDFVYDYLTNRYYLNNKNPFHNIAMKQSNVFETPEQLEPNNDFLNDIKINDIENPF